MNTDKYKYLWEKGNYDNVLIKGNVGYIIFNRINNSLLTIENEILNEQIIKKMLDNGNPIYKSIKDMKNNAKPINNVGQPSKAEDFPIKRYKLSIQWTENTSLITQIKTVKKVFPAIKDRTNQELFEIARKYKKWHFDTLYLDKDKVKEFIQLGEKYGLDIIIEEDDLKEVF